MRRVAIFGPSGSGKTTLGRWLGATLVLPFTDLDDLHWRPGWCEAPPQEFQQAVAGAVAGDAWVIAGNYAVVRDLIWRRADTLIWLDLPLLQVLSRSVRRATRQWWTREPICNGNYQTLLHIINGRDSLVGYTLRTYHRRRRHDWPAALAGLAHAKLYRLGSAAEVDRWQRQVQAGNTPVDR